jgi:hypothetical protein
MNYRLVTGTVQSLLLTGQKKANSKRLQFRIILRSIQGILQQWKLPPWHEHRK